MRARDADDEHVSGRLVQALHQRLRGHAEPLLRPDFQAVRGARLRPGIEKGANAERPLGRGSPLGKHVDVDRLGRKMPQHAGGNGQCRAARRIVGPMDEHPPRQGSLVGAGVYVATVAGLFLVAAISNGNGNPLTVLATVLFLSPIWLLALAGLLALHSRLDRRAAGRLLPPGPGRGA